MDKKIAGGANPHGLVVGTKKTLATFYQAPIKIATSDIGEFRSIGDLTRDVVLKCFAAKYNIRPALAATVFELSQHGRAT